MDQSYCDKFYIYFTQGLNGIEFNLTSNPSLTISYLYQELRINQGDYDIGIIEPSLRIGEAYYLSKLLADSLAKKSLLAKIRLLTPKKDFSTAVNKINKHLAFISTNVVFQGISFKTTILDLREDNINLSKSSFSAIQEIGRQISTIYQFLQGRILYREEISQCIEELGFDDLVNNLSSDCFEWLRLNQMIEILPSITYQSLGVTNKANRYCFRCGQSNSIHPMKCIRCGQGCFYCENCVAMGEASICRPLYSWNSQNQQAHFPPIKTSNSLVQENLDPLKGKILTPAQQKAYVELQMFIVSPEEKALLIAVCGAGKTEIVFGAIQRALSQGKRVLFTIPRKDVVLELLPRLKSAFPQYRPIPLYGGSPDKYVYSQLVIATTHQALRFSEAFDLVILDEVDAFPYKGNQMLKHAVERAKRKSGKIIYMTATPSQELLLESKKDHWTRLTIPARHHGYPVPEPNFIVEKSTSLLTSKVMNFIIRSLSQSQCQLFIFVPSIELAERVGQLLREKFETQNINPNLVQFSHSKDKEREFKREKFSKGEFPIFVTTSIMERGVTVPKANVLVLFAHWAKIYDQGTLIQMAGRAGRSKDYPYGEVIFHGALITKAMQEARKLIINLNKEASKAGYLHQEKI